MQQTFTKEFMMANSGCYSKERLMACSFMKSDTIDLHDILTSEIRLKDKFWFVCKKLATREQNQQIAIDVAEIVLPIFEKRYPEVKRPREAIEAAKSYIAGHISLQQLLEKRYAATATAAATAYATYAAYATANAANAATAAANAATTAAATAYAATATAAAYATANAANAAYAAANAAANAANAAYAAATAYAYATAYAAYAATAYAATATAAAAAAAITQQLNEYLLIFVEVQTICQ